MKNSRLLLLIGGGLILALAQLIYQQFYQPSLSPLPITSCADLTQPCRISNTSYYVYTDHQPSRLVPFMLTLQGKAQRVSVSFTMQDMEMGPHQYTLLPHIAKNTWQAKIILPACIKGRRDWHMTIYIDNVPLGQVAFYNKA
jgi:hypothetical protein